MGASILLYLALALLPLMMLQGQLGRRKLRKMIAALPEKDRALIIPPDNEIPKGPERTEALNKVDKHQRRSEIMGVAMFVVMIALLILHAYLT